VSVAPQPAVGTSIAQPKRRKRWRIILGCLLALLAVPVGIYLFVKWSSQRDLQAAIAETDALDPRWRLDDLLADREPLPDEQNPALVSLKVHDLVSRPGFDLGEKNLPLFENMAPEARLNAAQIAVLREALGKQAKAIKVARTLKDFRGEGRFPVKYDPSPTNTSLEPLHRNRNVMSMLMYDAMLRAEEGDVAGAMESCRALLVGARSIGQEPFLIAMLIRVSGGDMVVQALERTLAQGEPPANELKAIQELLAAEIEAPILYQALRGERAGGDRLIVGIDAGTFHISELTGGKPNPREIWLTDKLSGLLTRERPEYLRMMNKAVVAAKLPPEKQGDAFRQVERQFRERTTGSPLKASLLLRLMLPNVIGLADANRRNQANLPCALCGVAAERYRRKHRRWPDSLEDLVTEGLLKAVPVDPFDGRPLRYRAVPDGVVIYSVSHDGVDNGGALNRTNPLQVGTDLGFRLWDVDARRAAPQALPPPEKPGGPP
jgi:hypothetical protein